MQVSEIKSDAQNAAKAPLKVLLVGQSGEPAGALEGVLRARGLSVRRARTARDGVTAAQSFAPDLLILHWSALDIVGPKFMRMLLDEKLPRLPYVVANAAPFDLTLEEASEALIVGADAFLSGAPRAAELDATLHVARRQRDRELITQEHLRRLMTKLSEVQSNYDSIDGDLIEARKLQQGLMKDRHLDLGFMRLSTILRSSGHVGGDLVGHFPINEVQHGFFALDVSGHGVSSALMTARLAGYLSQSNPRQNIAIETHGEAHHARSPAAAMADLNQLVMEDMETDHYFTMLLGYVEPEIGKVVMSQAGHPHPAWQRPNGSVEFVGDGGLPVGLIPGADYENFEMTLEPGDRLLLLSDGFTESTLKDGSFLGDEGLVELLAASRSLSGVSLLEALVWDLSERLGDDAFQDDLSGVLIEYRTAGREQD